MATRITVSPTTTDLPDRPGISELAGRTIADLKTYARAEIALVKGQVAARAAGAKGAAIFLVAALLLAIGAVGALLVGLIMTLATLVGPGWATLIVVGLTLVVAGLLAWLGIKRLTAPVLDEEVA